ncbi:hypothetical protein CVT24_012556 [Panaeolus cyanescens]|uniref:Uncharacterized protein n=1 Tax=Panaeolus cyanescens TaxID=181874 RepID=A0A409WUE8_9AGAR|nr:hypothetical protein CVT24_012556 [Panaeolus cyanescens]
MHCLVTPFELKSIFNIYAAPGLADTWFLYLALVVFYIGPEHKSICRVLNNTVSFVLVHLRARTIPEIDAFIVYEWTVRFLIFATFSIVVMTPLEVVLVRLSLQRTLEPVSQPASAGEDPSNAQSQVSESATVNEGDQVMEENVIETHSDDDPYTGLYDCLKRIVKEEDWSALYRGWWATVLFRGFFSSLV